MNQVKQNMMFNNSEQEQNQQNSTSQFNMMNPFLFFAAQQNQMARMFGGSTMEEMFASQFMGQNLMQNMKMFQEQLFKNFAQYQQQQLMQQQQQQQQQQNSQQPYEQFINEKKSQFEQQWKEFVQQQMINMGYNMNKQNNNVNNNNNYNNNNNSYQNSNTSLSNSNPEFKRFDTQEYVAYSKMNRPFGVKKIGSYSLEERAKKIKKYKDKLLKWKMAHPLSRQFSGRSQVANKKPRVKGRFVKNDDDDESASTKKSMTEILDRKLMDNIQNEVETLQDIENPQLIQVPLAEEEDTTTDDNKQEQILQNQQQQQLQQDQQHLIIQN